MLNQGQQYLLFLMPTTGSRPFTTELGLAPQATYPNGSSYFFVGLDPALDKMFTQPWTALPFDMAFEITYQPVLVPEPSSMALFCFSSLALWLRRRK